MILPPQRGQTRPLVVFFSTFSASGLSSAIRTPVLPQDYEDRTEDRNGRNQQHEHPDVEVAHEMPVIRASQHGTAHCTLRVRRCGQKTTPRRPNHTDHTGSPPITKRHRPPPAAGAPAGASLNL